MIIETGLISFLKSDSGISSLVGGRVYPIQIPQGESLPAVVFQRISTYHVQSMQGCSGLADAFFQITSWASTPLAAKQLSEKCRLALQGYSGTLGGSESVAILMDSGEYDIPASPEAGEEAGASGVGFDVQVTHNVDKPNL